jgi:hypothetical protein
MVVVASPARSNSNPSSTLIAQIWRISSATVSRSLSPVGA